MGNKLKFKHKLALAFMFMTGLMAPIFRKTIYHHIPVAPGEPYGLGDVLELVIGLFTVLICLLGLSLGTIFLFLPKLKDPSLGKLYLIFSSLAFLIFFGFHYL